MQVVAAPTPRSDPADAFARRLEQRQDDQPVVGFSSALDVDAIAGTATPLLMAMIDAYRDENGCHLETLMGALAALAGEFALRAGAEAHREALPTGTQYILGGLADPYIWGDGADGKPSLLGLVTTAAVRAGADRDALPNPRAIAARAVAAIADQEPYPPRPAIPDANMPHEWSPNACALHRLTVLHVMGQNGVFEPEEIALALGFAMSKVFELAEEGFASGMVTPNTMAQLAAEMMIAVARMAPLEAPVT